MLHGTCACGQVSFAVSGMPEGASVCHCTQCRKMSGHAWASAYAPKSAIAMKGPVKWVRLSPKARRGICAECGSFLFWKADADQTMSFALGALDGPTGLSLEKHIFTAEMGDYYRLCDEIPQK